MHAPNRCGSFCASLPPSLSLYWAAGLGLTSAPSGFTGVGEVSHQNLPGKLGGKTGGKLFPCLPGLTTHMVIAPLPALPVCSHPPGLMVWQGHAEVVIQTYPLAAEGPVWCPKEQCLWYVDMAHKVWDAPDGWGIWGTRGYKGYSGHWD